MNRHFEDWIGAYHDGELRPDQRQQIENHLSGCLDCQATLRELRLLSALLQEAPVPASGVSPERFSTQVFHRIGKSKTRPTWQPMWRVTIKTAWQVAPLFLIALGYFSQAILNLGSLGILLGLAQAGAPGLLPSFQLEGVLSGMFVFKSLGAFLASVPILPVAGLGLLWISLSVDLAVLFGGLLWGWVAGWWALSVKQ